MVDPAVFVIGFYRSEIELFVKTFVGKKEIVDEGKINFILAVIEKYKTASNENTVNGALKAVSEEKVATAVIAIASIMIVALVLNALFPKINKW
jgi:hypothetical protein